MINAKEAKNQMIQEHMSYKKELMDWVINEADKRVREAMKHFRTETDVNVLQAVREEAIKIFKENGYEITTNGPDSLILSWKLA